ncbi:hypothetical protein [Streptomyces tendae]|uniref:hypothetical protein n=1 Tax=Streptomyces tendae TaxID=1932 RepID=UPI0024926F24|nr:hypothetical protein [Streptomyces tendae]
MTASGPGSGDTPGEPDGTPAVPEYVWRLFLEDDERAIRASAPREPSARDRVPGWRPEEPPVDRPDHPGRSGRPPRSGHADRTRGTVGEAWRREETWAGPRWRELDGRARLRRVGRVAGTAAAVALALTAWSQLSTGPATPGGEPAETIGQRLEESPALPTADSGAKPPTDSLAPTGTGAASPAVFEPAPSAIPRASTSSWTFD